MSHHNHAIPFVAGLLASALAISAATAQATPPTGESGNTLVTVTAEPSVESIRGGEKFLLAFHFEIAPRWHIYWKNPGDTGAPTMIEVTAPEGFEVGEIIWPRPRNIPGMFTTYGYEKEATLFVPVRAPETLADGEATFTAAINWLVCQESCLMGDATIDVSIDTSAAPASDDSAAGATAEPLSEFRISDEGIRERVKLLPRPLDSADGASIERVDNRIVLSGPAHGESSLMFFPSHSPGVSSSIVKQVIENDRFTILLDIKVNPTATLGHPPIPSGVIALGTGDDDPGYSFEVALDE